MTVNSSIVCGRAHPYIMCPKMSPKPCWRRIAFPDSGKVVTGLNGQVHKFLTLLERLGLPVRTLDGKTLL